MKKITNIINKRQLAFMVAKKLQHSIHHMHVANIISLFMDEWATDLQRKEKINIPNFGLFKIEQSKPRKFHHIHKQGFAISSGKSLLKIKLSRSLRNKIIANIDIIKTFF